MDGSATPAPLSQSPTLRRRNSIATTTLSIPSELALPNTPHSFRSSSFLHSKSDSITPFTPSSALDLELVSLKSSFSSYISLRDLIPSTSAFFSSPACASSPSSIIGSGCEISIRNRLVKQAAWAYLQPMCSSSPNSSNAHFFRRLWLKLLPDRRSPLTGCLSFLHHKLIPGINHILNGIRRAICT